MKMMIDANDLVSDKVALLMVAKIVDREDGVAKFTGGLAVEIKTGKTQRSFKVTLQEAD